MFNDNEGKQETLAGHGGSRHQQRIWQRQEDLKFKANLGYITRSCLKKQALGVKPVVEHLPSIPGAKVSIPRN